MFLMTLTVLRHTGQGICGMSFIWDVTMFFSLLDWDYGLWERISQRKIATLILSRLTRYV